MLFMVVIAACLLRLFLILHNWPGSNADEATMGLMALHIEQGRDFPVFFYGQAYMGTLQAYLGSVLFRLFGVSLFSLRLGLILIFAAFLVVMYFLVKIVYNRPFALLCLLLYGVGSAAIIGIQLFANGGYSETVLFSALIFLLVARIILHPRTPTLQRPGVSRSLLLRWGLLGIIAGTAAYTDILILPTLVCAGILLVLFARRNVRSRLGLLLAGGFLLALLPAIIYNLSVPFSRGTIAAYAGSSGYAATTANRGGMTFAQQLLQALLITLPSATGLSHICSIQEPMSAVHPFFAIFGARQDSCALASAGWAMGYIILWVAASVQAIKALLLLRQPEHSGKMADALQRERALHWIRCMLLASAALTFMLYAVSAPAALNPRSTARYLFGMLIALPALAWPLWQGMQHRGNLVWRKRILPLALLLICVMFVKGTVDIMGQLDTYEPTIAQQQALIDFLLQHKLTRFYSDYWTCDNLIFQSQEQLVCAALDDQLQPGLDRYPPYREAVTAQPQAVYVFKAHSAQVAALDAEIRQHPQMHVTRTVVTEYMIYQSQTVLQNLDK